MASSIIVCLTLFQFPPLREGRPNLYSMGRRGMHFNSRPCARGDSIPAMWPYIGVRFQFPPLREGRLAGKHVAGEHQISIPAPARGATEIPAGPLKGFTISIPAPARGATQLALVKHRVGNISIPAPARGATMQKYHLEPIEIISIPAPARGATRAI